jgi:hypothetical protein
MRAARLLPLWLFLTALPAPGSPPGAAARQLEERLKTMIERGWSWGRALRTAEVEEAGRLLEELESGIETGELDGEELTDWRLAVHRMRGLLERHRVLCPPSRDIETWLPPESEMLEAAKSREARDAWAKSLDGLDRRVKEAFGDVCREDARAAAAVLDRYLKRWNEASAKAVGKALPRPPPLVELDRWLEERKTLARKLTPEQDARRRWDEYLMRFRWEAGVDDGPREILALGKRRFAETEAELADAARRIDPEKTWREIAEELRLDHPSPDELRDVCEKEMKAAIAFVREEEFVSVPEWALNVTAEWGDAQDRTPYGHYWPLDPADPALHGKYVVTPVTRLQGEEREEVLRGNNRAWIRVVSLHEAIPGHHLQFAIAAKRAREFRRHFYNPAYVEGWGLYCEELMHRHGYYDDRTRLSQLKMRLWRCARAVIDVGCQFGGMTRDEAVRLLVERVGIERASAEMEVGRYLASPGYYSGYLLGLTRIEALRAKAEAREGKGFSERRFHDRLLGLGPMPFSVLEEAMLRE